MTVCQRSIIMMIYHQVIERFSYQSIVTFGGCQEDFMLVVSRYSMMMMIMTMMMMMMMMRRRMRTRRN